MPIKTSTTHLALTGTGINMTYNSVLGKRYANATNIPITAPDAPNAGPSSETIACALSIWPVSARLTACVYLKY